MVLGTSRTRSRVPALRVLTLVPHKTLRLIAFFSGIDYLIPRHSWLHVAFVAALVMLLVVICY
jgi:hypothetical protein